MQWLRAHPYIALLIGAAILFALGAFIVSTRTAVAPENSMPSAWGTIGGGVFNPISQTPGQTSQQNTLYTDVVSGPPFHYDPTATQASVSAEVVDGFDLEAFLKSLSTSGSSASVSAETTYDSLDAYSFIPSGLISVSSFTRERTATEQALYEYGNEVGSTIETFEEIYRNGPQILKDQFEDRDDPAKKDALKRFAEGMSSVGTTLEGTDNVPSAVAPAHAKLAESYVAMGKKLANVPDARNDDEMLHAMLAYNETVETYTKNFISLALILSVRGITFTPEDPGSVFTFTQGGF